MTLKSERYQLADRLGIDMHSDELRPESDAPDTKMHYCPRACVEATLKELGTEGAWIKIDSDYTVEVHE